MHAFIRPVTGLHNEPLGDHVTDMMIVVTNSLFCSSVPFHFCNKDAIMYLASFLLICYIIVI